MPNTAPIGVAYSDPAIVSGSIDATPIGATTRSSVAATTVNATGAVTANSATAVPAGGTAGAGLLMSSTANLGVFFGSGAPTLSAAQGSLYIRTDGSSTSTRLYVNTNGTTGWTNITSAT